MLVGRTVVAVTLVAILVPCVSAAALVGVAAGSTGAVNPAPWRVPVPTYIRPGETVMITRAVNAGGTAWVATDVLPPHNLDYPTVGRIRIYRFVSGRWRQSGAIHDREMALNAIGGQCAFPYVPNQASCFAPAWLTDAGVPDYVTSWCCGADSPPELSIIRLAGGVWRPFRFRLAALASFAPFRGELQYSETEGGFVDRHLLVLGGDSCSCASGLSTWTYFRFSGSTFVPTYPPGPLPACTTAKLNASGPLKSPEADFLLTDSARFRVTRAACADGWALGAGVHGKIRRLVIFTQRLTVVHSQIVPTNGWYRQAYGTWKDIRSYGFAIPPALLKDLAAAIGKPHPWPYGHKNRRQNNRVYRVRREGGGGGPPPVHWGHLPLYRYNLLPGAGFASAVSAIPGKGEWFAIASGQIAEARAARATVTLTIARWRRHAWSPPAPVSIHLPAPFSRTPAYAVAIQRTHLGPEIAFEGSAG
jgi:hypothetical protein